MNTSFLDLFQAAIGVYMLIAAISGKGKIYENEYVKEGCEQKYRKTMRISLFILGPLCMLGAALNLFKVDESGILFPIIWGLTVAGFIVLIVMTARLTDKKKKLAPPTEEGKPRKHPAFDFDEDEDVAEVPAEEAAEDPTEE
ncbi:MAG: hypothetical protein IJP37_06860 [Clostridia bacterium]|nr:hypothetical protein [Clostridia bacterium]